MTSFRDARDFLTTALFDNVISEDEYIILYDLNSSKNLDLPYDEFMRFDVDEMEDSECVAELRVHKHGLPALAEALQIPRVFRCRQRSISDGMEGLCTLLRRLAYPCRYSDMMARFGRPAPVLSMRKDEVLDFIYTNHSHRILQWNPAILQPVTLKEHANAIQIKGSAIDNCFGVIDGTVRPISRPGRHQRIVYNGHKRLHALKSQSVNSLTQLWSRLNLLSERSEIQLNNYKGIVSSTILRRLALQKARRKNRPPKLPLSVSIFSKPLELKFQLKTSISPIVSLPELSLLALDQLSSNSQEEL